MFLTKADWMPEWAFRALRTFAQSFAGVFGATLIAVLTNMSETHAFDWDTLLYGGIISGIAAGIAALMNLGSTG